MMCAVGRVVALAHTRDKAAATAVHPYDYYISINVELGC